jgi:hypothetical protein
MQQVCFAFAVVAGKTAGARALMRELDGARKAEYAASERRIGIVKECWFLQQTPLGDLLIGYMKAWTATVRCGSSRNRATGLTYGSRRKWPRLRAST